MADKQPILITIFLPHEWSVYARRPHWSAVSQKVNVLLIEPPTAMLFFWRHPGRLLSYFKSKSKVRRLNENILMFRPLSLSSHGISYRIPLLAIIDRMLISLQLRKVIRSLKENYVSIVSFTVKVQQYYVADIVNSDLNCYEITDEYRVKTGFEKYEQGNAFSKRAIRRESEILASADVVIASSLPLYESRKKIHSNTFYLKNCADYNHFAKSPDANSFVAEDIQKLPKPILGFLGNITDLVDLDLVNQLAHDKANWSLVFIGRNEISSTCKKLPSYSKFKSLPNIHLLGFKPYDHLPGYLKEFDVALMPFKQNVWLYNSSPNKIYQYLAAGLPIVSIAFPEIEAVKEVVFVAESRAQFIKLLENALNKNSADDVTARREVAKQFTTEKRSAALIEILEHSLARKSTK